MSSHSVAGLLLIAGACLITPAWSQAISFESNGLKYQTITKAGLTIMFAPLPTQVKNYMVLQLAVSNGSPSTRTIKPEDFRYVKADGTEIPATPARAVVQKFLDKGGRSDVVNMVGTYELGLYGLSRFQSTNGYEQRRQAALAEVNSSKLKAAAAASAIVLIATKLKAGESTDGAIFFPFNNQPLGPGKLVAVVGAERFEFEVGGFKHPSELIRRP